MNTHARVALLHLVMALIAAMIVEWVKFMLGL